MRTFEKIIHSVHGYTTYTYSIKIPNRARIYFGETIIKHQERPEYCFLIDSFMFI